MEVDGKMFQACRFRDLKLKDFISTCCTASLGNPKKTKHHGLVPHLHVVEEYLKYAASIDVHNHYRRGSCGLEDMWHTKNHTEGKWQESLDSVSPMPT